MIAELNKLSQTLKLNFDCDSSFIGYRKLTSNSHCGLQQNHIMYSHGKLTELSSYRPQWMFLPDCLCVWSEKTQKVQFGRVSLSKICVAPVYIEGFFVNVSRVLIVYHCKVELLKYSVNLVKC